MKRKLVFSAAAVSAALVGAAMLLGTTASISAADLSKEPEIPAPAAEVHERGIWGAIAFSESDGKYGFFWGADKRDEANEIALKHCKHADGGSCVVVQTFRNHRHWTDDDESGFPYNHCAALAVSQNKVADRWIFGSMQATTRKDAEDLSLRACGEGGGGECKIKEWVCT